MRMSPWTCSHSGLSARLTSSMPGAGSTSTMSNRALRWDALFPPPLSELQQRLCLVRRWPPPASADRRPPLRRSRRAPTTAATTRRDRYTAWRSSSSRHAESPHDILPRGRAIRQPDPRPNCSGRRRRSGARCRAARSRSLRRESALSSPSRIPSRMKAACSTSILPSSLTAQHSPLATIVSRVVA